MWVSVHQLRCKVKPSSMGEETGRREIIKIEPEKEMMSMQAADLELEYSKTEITQIAA